MRNRQWRNKAINDTYEPGSTFKSMVLAAALEEGVGNENSTFYCPGFYVVADRTISCSKKAPGHGHMILRSILTKIFHGVDHVRTVLNLIKNNKRFFRQNFLATDQHEILQNPVHILCRFKKLPVLFIFIKVKISSVLIKLPAKLF